MRLNNNIISIQNGNSINLANLNLLIGNSNLLQNAVSFDKLANCSVNNQTLKYYTTDPDGAGPLVPGWNCDNSGAGLDVQNLSFDNSTGTLSIDNANSVVLPTNLGVTGVTITGSGSSQVLNLSRNGASTLSVAIPDAGTVYLAGAGIEINSDTINIANVGVVNSMLASNSVNSTNIIDGSVGLADLASCSSVTSPGILVYHNVDPDGAGPLVPGWNCDTDNGITTETDGIIGNEILDTGTSTGLVRNGTGTTFDPYTVDIKACGNNEVLKYNTTSSTWDCGADSNTLYTAGNGIVINSGSVGINSPTCSGTTKLQWTGSAFVCSPDVDTTSFNISANNGATQNINSASTINFNNGIGINTSRSGNDFTFDLSNTTVTPGSNYNNVTVDAQGRITSASNIAYLTAETDGVIGNEILNATTSGGLVRSGAGTSVSPYTLGIATGGITADMIGDNSITSSKIAQGAIALVDMGNNSVDSTKIIDGSIALADLANNSIDSSKIIDGSVTGSDIASGTITNGNLLNSSLTVVSGSGLINGGTVSLGGTTTLNIGAGNGISVNADDIAVRTAVSTDGLSSTTSSGSGIEVLASGVTLLQGCSDGQILKWNETSDVWACNLDNGVSGVGTLDSATKSANGAVISGNNIVLQTADATNPGLVSTGTQTFGGNKTFAGNVTNSGNTNLNTIDGAGLSSCSATTSKLQYDSTAKQFVCGTDSSSNTLAVRKTADESVALSLTLQNDDHISLPVAANEKWAFNGYLNMTSGSNIKTQMTIPSAGSICMTQISETSTGSKRSTDICNQDVVPSSNLNTGSGGAVLQFYGTFSVGSTGGTARFQWSQASALATPTTLKAGSYIIFTKITGADLAEIYYSEDDSVEAGDLVSLSGDGVSQVERSEISKRENIIGIVSTKPGQVLAEDDGQGKPVPVALTGRVPIKVTNENGEIKAGDQITVSDTTPGYGAKAITSGRVVGKALADATPDGRVTVFVEPGYWQAPLNFDLSSIFADESDALEMNTSESFVDTNTEIKDAVIKNLTSSKQFKGMDQTLVDQIQKGFKTQQDQIVDINKQILELKSSDSNILQQIGDKIESGQTTDDATQSVTGVKLVNGSGLEYISSLEAIKSGNQITVAKNGETVDYDSVVGYLVQALQDQQVQIDKLAKGEQVDLNESETGISLDLETFKKSFLGQLEEVKKRIETLETSDQSQDKKLNTLEQENEDLKKRLEKIEKALIN